MFKINTEMLYVFLFTVWTWYVSTVISVSESKMLASVVRLNLQVNDVKDARHTPKYWPGRTIKGYLYSKMRVLRRWRKAVERMKESYLSFHHDILCSYRTNCLTFLHITSHSLLECFKHHKTKDFRLSWRTGPGYFGGYFGVGAGRLEDQQRGDWARFIRFHRISLFWDVLRYASSKHSNARRASLAGECVYGLPGSSHIEVPNHRWKERVISTSENVDENRGSYTRMGKSVEKTCININFESF